MYNPQHFKSENSTEAFELMDYYPFATVISVADGVPVVSHLPLTPKKIGDEIQLIGHLAKANSHWKHLANNPVTAVFHGPHTFVTPAWYVEKSVPTWSYLAVHAFGRVELIEDYDGIVDCLKALVDHTERHWPSGWQFEVPEIHSRSALPKSIAAFKITVDKIEFKKKISQNKSSQDRVGVFKGLAERADDNSRLVLNEMKKIYSESGELL